MAIDLEAIRRKVDQLNGIKNKNNYGNVKLWKPKLGEHRIRVLPWTDAVDGVPFKERYVYFGIGKGPMVSPESFGKFDPIREFTKKLWDGGKEEDKNLAKKLFAKLQTCAAIVDRSAEDEGPQLWIMNKLVAKDVMALFLNAEVGDFTDIGPEGRDIVVTITVSPKKFNGRTVNDVKIMPAMKNTPASTDKAKVDKWMETLPNIDEYYRPLSSEDVKKRFDEWINNGGVEAMMNPETAGNAGTETDRGESKGSDAIDSLADAVNAAKDEKPAAKKAEEKPKAKAKKENKEFANVEDALDDALGDLSDLE